MCVLRHAVNSVAKSKHQHQSFSRANGVTLLGFISFLRYELNS